MFNLTTSSGSGSEAAQGNSAAPEEEQPAEAAPEEEQPAEAAPEEEQPAEAAPEEEQPISREWLRQLTNIAKAVKEGALQPDTLQTATNLALQVQRQRAEINAQKAEIRHKDDELTLRKELAQAKENRLSDQMKAKQDRLRDQMKANEDRWREQLRTQRARWEAEIQAETLADKIRSFVLVLVVLAVVATPIYAMARDVLPTAFLQYVAPITAISGTVLGYWFGLQDRGPRRRTSQEVSESTGDDNAAPQTSQEDGNRGYT